MGLKVGEVPFLPDTNKLREKHPLGRTSRIVFFKIPIQREQLSPEELQKKREEAERKARRGEIDPMHEFAFQVIGQVSFCH